MATEKKLTGEQQLFVVKCFACFMTPSEIEDLVKEVFGVTVTRQAIHYYNPRYRALPADLKAQFDTERARFVKDVNAHGVAHQAYRLSKIQHVIDHFGRNPMLTLQAVEQGAKEMGGKYTNHKTLSVDDARAKLAGLLGVAPEQLPPVGK